MTIKQMQYLDAIYRYKNFTKAAKTLYISQPSISNAITAMEDELGFKLIDRNPKLVTFTPEGNSYMSYVKQVIHAYNQAEAFAAKLVQSKNSVLNIGLEKAGAIEFLRVLYDEFVFRWPDSEINIVAKPGDELVEMLMNEELDLLFEVPYYSIDETVLTRIPFGKYIVQAVVRKDSEYGKLNKIPLKKLNGTDCIVVDTDQSWVLTMIEELSRYNCLPKISTGYGYLINFYETIAKRGYVGLIQTSVDSAVSFGFEDDLVVKPIDCEDIVFYTNFLYKKSRPRSDIAQDMIDFFIEHYGREK